MTLIRLFAIGKILGIELVPSDEVKIPPTQIYLLCKNGDFTWRVSDCEELVGVAHRRLWGWFLVLPKDLISRD